MAHFTTKDGVELYYRDWGVGKPIVLIHGWPLNADMWEPQSLGLAEAGFRVISYDRRGFGRSGQPWSGYDYGALADDLDQLLTHLQISGATLVGFSMGGGEVARYFSAYGGKAASRAVFVASVAPFLLQKPDNPDGVASAVFEAMIADIRQDRPAFLTEFSDNFYGVGVLTSPVSDEYLDWTAALAYLASPRAMIECVKSLGYTDFRADVATIKVPTLIVHGDSDKIVPVAIAKANHRLIAGSTLKIYQGAPHGLHVTHAENLLNDLISFA
jgi:non-heme chloroperoxidase